MNRMRRAALKRLGLSVAAAPMLPGAVVGAATANLGATQGVQIMGRGGVGNAIPAPGWERLGVPEAVWTALRRDVERERERAAWLQTALLGAVDADIQAMASLSVTAKARMMARRSAERARATRSWNERLWGRDDE